MTFNDDEEVVIPNPVPRPQAAEAGRVQYVRIFKGTASLKEHTRKVLLELTGDESIDRRSGLDLVAVLDVSGSMQGPKIEKMKIAIQFVIKKLSPIDRLSIVTFSNAAHRLCPLRQVTEASRPELQKLIDGLRAGGGTNISKGLRTGLDILTDRKFSVSRDVGVMLMSDGDQTEDDAAKVVIGNVPVYTFGFGEKYKGDLLTAVACNSNGGMFNAVGDIDGLSQAFSQSLAGLLSVVAYDLKLTLTRVKNDSFFQRVTAGSYPKSQITDAGLETVSVSDMYSKEARKVTVKFGDLYGKEVRKVIVELLLPAVVKGYSAQILDVMFSYKYEGQPSNLGSKKIVVKRTSLALAEDDQPPREVETEEARLNIATTIKEARGMADAKNLKGAVNKLVVAQNSLEDLVEKASPQVEMLRTELKQLLNLMQSQEVYERFGRSYALSAESSHDRQRFAARGDIDKMRLFATPRMDKYLEQANRFDKDPGALVPSVDDDVKDELAANPLARVAGPITSYLQAAIQALQSIEELINDGGQS